jgi:hypothetical protein
VDAEVAFPSPDFNARHGTAVFTCVGGPTPWVFSNKNSNAVCGVRFRDIADAGNNRAVVCCLIGVHIDNALIALQQKLYSQSK